MMEEGKVQRSGACLDLRLWKMGDGSRPFRHFECGVRWRGRRGKGQSMGQGEKDIEHKCHQTYNAKGMYM